MAPIHVSTEEERRRKIVGINAETVTNITSTDFPGHYPGEDHTWSLEKFEENFHIRFHHNSPHDARFSLIGIDASIANAFRRILLAEIPTLAIETVFIFNNTSIVADEVLSHRLGLIPLTGSLQGLQWLRYEPRKVAALGEESGAGAEEEREAKDHNTVVLNLKIECSWREGRRKEDTDPEKLYVNSNVYAHHLQFDPKGRQTKLFPTPDGLVRPTNPDILIAKLRPGQVIDADLHAIKGVGADHAKFSPVATASYRLLPTIEITRPILGQEARKFARCFPKGVIGLEDVTEKEAEAGGAYEGKAGEKKAVVRDVMRDTVSRECLRHEEFVNKVKLGRVRDHFVFQVESVGQVESDLLFLESVRILKGKCRRLKRCLGNVMR